MMTGGTSIPIGDHTYAYSTFSYWKLRPGTTDVWDFVKAFNSETKGATTNFYYKINGRSGNSFIISTGVYVDISIEIPWQLVTGMDFVPDKIYYRVHRSTMVSIEDTNSSQYHEQSFNDTDFFGNTYWDYSGTLLNYEVRELPYDDYYSDWPTRYGCKATYRFWLCDNFDFLLEAAAKLKVTQRISLNSSNTGAFYSEYVYLHFDNVPYITCPTEISDEDYGFNVEYSFPNLSKIQYIQFTLCDENDNPIIDYRDIPRTSNNYRFDLSDETELAKLYARYNTVNEATIYLSIKYKSTSDTSPTYLAYPINFTIVPEKPTMTVGYSDPKGLADPGVFIEGKSDLRVVVNPRAYKGATIEHVDIYNGGQVYANQNDVTFTRVTDKQFEVLCIDSRGNKYGTWYELSNWVPYIPPSCSITAEAPNTDGYLPVTVSGIYFDSYKTYFTNGFNIYYKYTSSNPDHSLEEWTQLTPRPTLSVDRSYRYSTTFEILVPNHADTYTVQVQFSDKYTTYTTNSITVKALPVFDWGQEDFNFNVPVTIQGDLVVTGQIVNPAMTAAIEDTIPADYVVQTGKSGIWTYRLWNSGVAECWGRLLPTQYTINTAWGALYVKDNAILRQDYPFTFKELPVVSMSLYNTVGNCWAYTGTVGSTSQSPAYGLARGTSGSVTVGVELTAIGKWK